MKRQYLPNWAVISSAIMSTSMLPEKGGIWGLVRIGADNLIICCPPSLVKYVLTGKLESTACCRGGQYFANMWCNCSYLYLVVPQKGWEKPNQAYQNHTRTYAQYYWKTLHCKANTVFSQKIWKHCDLIACKSKWPLLSNSLAVYAIFHLLTLAMTNYVPRLARAVCVCVYTPDELTALKALAILHSIDSQ